MVVVTIIEGLILSLLIFLNFISAIAMGRMSAYAEIEKKKAVEEKAGKEKEEKTILQV